MPSKLFFNATPGNTQRQQPGPFAPTTWDQLAVDGSQSFSIEERNRLNNAGIYLPGTHGAANATANGTGQVLTRYADPAGGAGVQTSPTWPTVPQPSYDAVGGVGRPAAAAPAAKMTLRQGQPVPRDARNFDLVGGGGSPVGDLRRYADAQGAGSLALDTIARPYVGGAGGGGKGGGDDLDLSTIPPAALTALGLENMEQAYGAGRALKLLHQQGALPTMTDSPEVFSNKMGYLRQLNQGQLDRASGTPGAVNTRQAAAGARGAISDLVRYGKDGPFTPRVIDLGNGVQAMTTSPKSAVPLNNKAAKTLVRRAVR